MTIVGRDKPLFSLVAARASLVPLKGPNHHSLQHILIKEEEREVSGKLTQVNSLLKPHIRERREKTFLFTVCLCPKFLGNLLIYFKSTGGSGRKQTKTFSLYL